MKILFFIGSLNSGGKERRLVELLSYLNNKKEYEILVLLAYNEIAYTQFKRLNINYIDLQKKTNSKNIKLFFKIHRIIKKYKPDIIHTWGNMQTFYMIPSTIIQNIPLINSQITTAPPKLVISKFERFVNYINFKFSDINLSNSYAGLNSFKISNDKKSKVIYNGINLERFNDLLDADIVKKNFKIETKFVVIMVASFSYFKDYDRFIDVAEYVTKKNSEITFIGIGGIADKRLFEKVNAHSIKNKHIIIRDKITDVESLINISDIGVLFSTMGEGISNTILEYMALEKTIIADDCGGSKEFVINGVNGFLIKNLTIEGIGELIIDLLYKELKRKEIGSKARNTIISMFTLEKMGIAFEKLYNEVYNNQNK